MSTGAIAGAASRRAERRLVEHLREALDASSAIPIPDQNWMGRRALQRLIKAGAVREAGDGYYLDEAAYAVFRSRRARNTALIMAPLTVAAILVIWWASGR
ncbi:hypothetical protein [Singulisphaera sp. PoT]|uniref:hypothetical protein n=1 Tax=Singulisphaera sp. PoT TaxID=3411797 RepID=UPI003BF57B19